MHQDDLKNKDDFFMPGYVEKNFNIKKSSLKNALKIYYKKVYLKKIRIKNIYKKCVPVTKKYYKKLSYKNITDPSSPARHSLTSRFQAGCGRSATSRQVRYTSQAPI